MTKPTMWLCAQRRLRSAWASAPVWSESSLYAWRKLGSLATYWAHSKDSDLTGRMPRLIWVFAGRTHFVGFVMLRLTFLLGSLSWGRWTESHLGWSQSLYSQRILQAGLGSTNGVYQRHFQCKNSDNRRRQSYYRVKCAPFSTLGWFRNWYAWFL